MGNIVESQGMGGGGDGVILLGNQVQCPPQRRLPGVLGHRTGGGLLK
tara:strand:- start:116535 stop:116675 length:141 start_codon:yes stop_codon:yes gene_type:complete